MPGFLFLTNRLIQRMDNFFSHIQPPIVHLSNDACIPKSLRNKYCICIYTLGIKWFEENYISLEVEGVIEGESLGPKFLMLEDSGANKLDVPRIYIPLTETVNKELMSKFWISGLTNNDVYATGISGFRPGKDYYVNSTMYTWLTRKTDHVGEGISSISEENDDIVLPDYLYYDRETDSYGISESFVSLTTEENKTYDLDYFTNKNKINSLEFTEDELSSLPQTFFNIILDYNLVSEDVKSISPNNGYLAVMKYFANYKSDAATVLLQTIFNTDIVEDNSSSTSKSYTCNTCTNTVTSTSTEYDPSTATCYEKYQNAMNIWLEQMLSNIDYYDDWFMYVNGSTKYANYDMIDLLIKLLESAIEYNVWPSTTTTRSYNCNCPSLDSSYSDDECNKNIVKNYIKVLQWVRECKLKENKNKIKVYGKEFATLLEKY